MVNCRDPMAPLGRDGSSWVMDKPASRFIQLTRRVAVARMRRLRATGASFHDFPSHPLSRSSWRWLNCTLGSQAHGFAEDWRESQGGW